MKTYLEQMQELHNSLSIELSGYERHYGKSFFTDEQDEMNKKQLDLMRDLIKVLSDRIEYDREYLSIIEINK